MTTSDVKPLRNTCSVVLSIALLALAHQASAQGETIEIRVTGEHHLAAGDTTESAAVLALVDARQKAVHAAAARLRQSARLRALGLKPGHLEAFTAVLVRAGEPSPLPTPLVSGTAHRVELRALLNAGDAERRVVDLYRDEEAAYELVAAWTETERLVKQLSDLARRPSGAASDAARIAREQTAIVSAIEVQALTAQAYGAFVRNIPAPVGARP